MEVYVDDILVKSLNRADNVKYLEEAFACWPKSTLFDFVLMITNHMKLFGTN